MDVDDSPYFFIVGREDNPANPYKTLSVSSAVQGKETRFTELSPGVKSKRKRWISGSSSSSILF